MSAARIVVSLPIADRPVAHRFYRDVLGLEPIGEPAEDGVPEPLQLRLGEGVNLMLVPHGGFGWVLGDRSAAAPGTSECLLSVAVDTDAEVDDLVARAAAAGAEVLTAPASQPWGYTAVVADLDGHAWMVTSGAF